MYKSTNYLYLCLGKDTYYNVTLKTSDYSVLTHIDCYTAFGDKNTFTTIGPIELAQWREE